MTPGMWIKLGLILAIVLAGLGWGEKRYRAGKRDANVAHVAVLAKISEATAKSARLAKEAEVRTASVIASIDQRHQTELRNAQDLHDTTVADILAGTVQLRDHWKGPGCPSVPGTPIRPREPDAEADDRAEGAGRIVQAAAECDAQVEGLQAIIRAERAKK